MRAQRPPGAPAPVASSLAATTGVVGIASVAHTALTGEVSPLAIAATLLTIGWLVPVGRGLVRARWSPDEAERLGGREGAG